MDYYEGISCPKNDNLSNDNLKIYSYDSEAIFEYLVNNYKDNSIFYTKVIEMSLFFPLNKLYTIDDFFSDQFSKKFLNIMRIK